MELGIGAGWKKDEWTAYGYGFPATGDRLGNLKDHLEVVTRMMDEGPATYSGDHESVEDAHNVPRPVQRPRVPIMVGGNGPEVTWRLAARYADELNVDGMSPAEVEEALPVVASRCEEIDRDPTTLPVSVHVWAQHVNEPGQQRVDRLAGYGELGVSRVMTIIRDAVDSDEPVEAFAEDLRAAGADLG
jgi:alkanesulfonate monooxygenase SsuD/methylene tetrahydromethanopterin reductase-like flavin-dependent oxidoreductase (luciferase family)